MHLPMRALAAVMVAALLVLPAVGGAVDSDALQLRYDAARDREDALLAAPRPDRAALGRVRAEIAAVERADYRPRDWRGARDVPPLRLPRGSMRARAERDPDHALATRLARLGQRFPGWAAFWIHDLTTGRTAGWNSDARFPAASTVKLGVVAAALRRWGPRPERSRAWYDLRQLTGWSSNLAANRLTARLTPNELSDGLRRLGMWSSTYPGPFRAGTAARADAPDPPPQTHWRVTTAHDLGRALYTFQAAAAGNRYVQRTSGLTRHQARLALALLVDSSSAHDNAGLLRPFLRGIPVAQKNGWISDTRATAGIVYLRGRPTIVVVLAYRPDLPRRDALRLGADVVRLVRS